MENEENIELYLIKLMNQKRKASSDLIWIRREENIELYLIKLMSHKNKASSNSIWIRRDCKIFK